MIIDVGAFGRRSGNLNMLSFFSIIRIPFFGFRPLSLLPDRSSTHAFFECKEQVGPGPDGATIGAGASEPIRR